MKSVRINAATGTIEYYEDGLPQPEPVPDPSLADKAAWQAAVTTTEQITVIAKKLGFI